MNQINFISALPVWPIGRACMMNNFVLFKAIFNSDEENTFLLRITGSSLYRIRLNGSFLNTK
ncbi:MAG: hypothetical protein IJW31_06900 [Lentisphaeria bacterium]|nr:hypothetical protein [Lentisphaeria bacterium]